jgi:hypothetical protein
VEIFFVAAIDSPGVDSQLRTVEGMDVIAHTIVAENGIDAGVSDRKTIIYDDRSSELTIEIRLCNVRWNDESIKLS